MTKMNVGLASAQMKYWRSFMAKTNIGMTSMLMWSVDEYWHDFNANVECCHGFMAKMNVDTTSVQMMVRLHSRCKYKWWCDFIVDASANIASWQRSQSSLESSSKASKNLNKPQISEALRIQVFKAPKNFHHKPSNTKNTKKTQRTWRTKNF